MEHKLTKKQQNKATGDIGEQLTVEFLIRDGFKVIERNYWKKFGELDVIVEKSNVVHFIEVKTVSYETKSDLEKAVTHETWRPEEQVHAFKLKQISKAIQAWLLDRNYQGDWQIDVAAVRIVSRETFATINLIENVIAD